MSLSGGTKVGQYTGDGQASQPTSNENWRNSTSFSPSLPQQEKGKDSTTTYATLSDGNLTIGGQATTTEALGIHNDAATAHQKVDTLPNLQEILDKQKTVADATSTIVAATRTYSQNQQQKAEAEKQASKIVALADLEAKGGEDWETYKNGNPAIQQAVLEKNSTDYKAVSDQAQAWGIGGDKSRAVNAVTAAITGALGGQTDLQVAVNSLAPYAAQKIGEQWGHGADQNKAAQLAAHAILGAALAYVNGGNAGAGGSAAVAAESAAEYLSNQYKDDSRYQNANGEFEANLLPEDVKAQIRDLTAAIGAVVGGSVGDSTFNAQIAGVIGQNAVENNIDSPSDYREAPERSKRMFDDTCAGLGLSPSDPACDAYIRKEGIQIIQGVALVFIPTEPYELIPIGKVFGVVVKGTKKLVAIFKDAKSAEKAVEKAGAKLDNNIHRDDDLFTTAPGGGAERSTKYSGNWQKADLKLTIEKFTGKNPKVERTNTGKMTYTNRENGVQVVYDLAGQYFRIYNPSLKGKRKYLDLNGNVPNNKVLPNGSKTGRNQSEYNEASHFKISNF